MQKENNRIVLTGGHAATTAMATVEELIRRDKDKSLEIYWIGVEKAVEGSSVKTMEAELMPKMGVYFKPINTGRIQRRFTLWTIPSLLKIPFGFISALFLLLKIKPKVILSFGGFASFPVVVCGWFLGIPIVIHEQTACIGRANKYSLFFADKVALSRESSIKYINKKNYVVTGNPVMTQITEVKPKNEISTGKPTLFIMGGSRGSQRINENIKPIIDDLITEFNVIHQVGPMDHEEYKTLEKSGYQVFDRIDPMKIDNVYREADIVVARAGANTVSEILVTGRPAILIPIPWSYMNEQYENAKYVEEIGLGEIIPQEKLSPKLLYENIVKIKTNWKIINKNVVSPDIEASKKLVDLLEEYIVR